MIKPTEKRRFPVASPGLCIRPQPWPGPSWLEFSRSSPDPSNHDRGLELSAAVGRSAGPALGHWRTSGSTSKHQRPGGVMWGTPVFFKYLFYFVMDFVLVYIYIYIVYIYIYIMILSYNIYIYIFIFIHIQIKWLTGMLAHCNYPECGFLIHKTFGWENLNEPWINCKIMHCCLFHKKMWLWYSRVSQGDLLQTGMIIAESLVIGQACCWWCPIYSCSNLVYNANS